MVVEVNFRLIWGRYICVPGRNVAGVYNIGISPAFKIVEDYFVCCAGFHSNRLKMSININACRIYYGNDKRTIIYAYSPRGTIRQAILYEY